MTLSKGMTILENNEPIKIKQNEQPIDIIEAAVMFERLPNKVQLEVLQLLRRLNSTSWHFYPAV